MDPLLVAVLGIAGMFLLIGLHVPIGVAMGAAGLAGFAALFGLDPALAIVKIETAALLTNTVLAVIPFFLFMGGLASVAGLSTDLYNLAYAVIGHRRGGLALATVGACAGFGAICGSSLATAATMGRIALPQMLARNYKANIASGTLAAGGSLGMLIPPSLVMVIYAVLTEQFVITMFVAALVPALLAVLLYGAAIVAYSRFDPQAAPAGEILPWRERLALVRRSWRVLLLAGLVSGGLYGGVLTVEEAAATGAGLTLVFALAGGQLDWRSFRTIAGQAAASTAMIYVLIIGATIFTYFISASQTPEAIVRMISDINQPPIVIIILILAMYLVLGSIFETISSMVITLPFVFPLVISMGYDPIWWGILMVMVIEIGLISPPIGMNVFVIHGVAPDIPLRTIFAGVVPFVGADIVKLALLIAFPALTLELPRILGYQ